MAFTWSSDADDEVCPLCENSVRDSVRADVFRLYGHIWHLVCLGDREDTSFNRILVILKHDRIQEDLAKISEKAPTT